MHILDIQNVLQFSVKYIHICTTAGVLNRFKFPSALMTSPQNIVVQNCDNIVVVCRS